MPDSPLATVSSGRLLVAWHAQDEPGDRLLAGVVADLVDADPRDVRIARTCRRCGSDRHGKPQVVSVAGAGPAVHVSLSRCAGTVLVAATDAGPLGVDVEPRGAAERAGLGRSTPAWVRWESLAKATGHGLTARGTPVEPEEPAWTFEVTAPTGLVACAVVLAPVAPRLVSRAVPAG